MNGTIGEFDCFRPRLEGRVQHVVVCLLDLEVLAIVL